MSASVDSRRTGIEASGHTNPGQRRRPAVGPQAILRECRLWVELGRPCRTAWLSPWYMNRSLVTSLLSPRVSADPDGGRHSERRHPVEHVAANIWLGPLIRQSPGTKPPADNGLVATHCGFGQAPAIVA